jgi:hypothetical protein
VPPSKRRVIYTARRPCLNAALPGGLRICGRDLYRRRDYRGDRLALSPLGTWLSHCLVKAHAGSAERRPHFEL